MTPGARLTVLAGCLIVGETVGFSTARVAGAWPWVAFAGMLLALVALGWNIRHLMPLFVFVFGLVAAMRTESCRVALLEHHWQSGLGGRRPVLELPVEGSVTVYHPAHGGMTVDFLSHIGPLPLKVVLRMKKEHAIPVPGEIWRCEGWVSRQSKDEGPFSRRMFWGNVGGMAIKVADPSRSFRRLAAISSVCSKRAEIGLDWCPDLASINKAILLGDRTGLPSKRRKVFARAGTVHVFAISGLHVMLIALMLMRFLTLLSVPVRIRGLVVVPVLAAYVLVTGLRPSAVRAAMMATICLTAPVLGRKGDPLAAWSLTALCVYGYAPERLFDTGCTLSFAAMFGIVAWLRWIRPMLPERGREGVLGECGVSLAAWVAGTPIVAHLFGSFTPGGLFANVLVLRLAACLVAFGMVGIACGFIVPTVAILFNNLAAAMAYLMMEVSEVVAAVPFASVAITPWTWQSCLFWYGAWAVLFMLLVRLSNRRNGVWWR